MEQKGHPTKSVEEMTAFFKVLGDETRMRIVLALSHQEHCVGELSSILGLTDSAVSHQLKALRSAGLVRARREGKNIYYMLADEHVTEILQTAEIHVHHKHQG